MPSPLETLPTSIHRHILSHLPWHSHIPASKACKIWNILLQEDEFKAKRYSINKSSGLILHRILTDPVGFKLELHTCGARKALVGMQFYTTEFAKKKDSSAFLSAMENTNIRYTCIFHDSLFPPKFEEEQATPTITKRNKLKRVRKPAFLYQNNNITTRWPMSIRIGLVNDPKQPAIDLVNINISESSKNRNMTVGELLEGIAEAVVATGPWKKLDCMSFELEMWQWLPEHYFGTVRKTNDPIINHPLMKVIRQLVQPGWRGKRARLAFRLRHAARKCRELELLKKLKL
ncbi:hypothetical protein TWF281_003811 [Arthrobotrys megalospora]